MSVAINRRVYEQRFRVIPVLLPGAKRESLSSFLVNTAWVEFRGSIDDSDAFHRLVCGIRGVAPRPGGPDARGSPRTTHNLPFAPNPAFTGREADLEKLGKLLQKRGEVAVTQTVALHGLGGVGKTQLAVEYAWKHLGGYEAVLWVRADSPQTLDASLAPRCHRRRHLKDYRCRRFDTAFGRLGVRAPRFDGCRHCGERLIASPVSELLPERVSPDEGS
jgi:hypothetical protein